jgi:hypothetical protein
MAGIASYDDVQAVQRLLFMGCALNECFSGHTRVLPHTW